MGDVTTLSSLGITGSSAQAALDQLRGAHPTLVVVACADARLGYAAALELAAADLPAGHEADLRRAEPDEDRWRTHEVNERIIAPAALKAFTRGHVVVADAEHMAARLHDHLLKTVEEPASQTQFWFCVKSAEALPVTLRGRAGLTLHLEPASAAEQLSALVAAGHDPQLTAEALDLSPDNARLAAVSATPERIDALRTLAKAQPTSSQPTLHAYTVLAAVIELARELGAEGSRRRRTAASAAPARSKGPRPRWDSLTPSGRVEARRLVRDLLRRWSRETAAAVGGAHTARTLRQVEQTLQALEAAATELSSNAPASTVLPALVARASA